MIATAKRLRMTARTALAAALVLGVCPPATAAAEPALADRVHDVVSALPERFYGSARGRTPLTPFDALQRIKAGQTVYVGLDTGRLCRATLPRWNKVWFDEHPSVSQHEVSINDRCLVRQRVKVTGVDHLLRLNAADRLTGVDTSAALSEGERQVADFLRRRAGGVHGSARVAWVFDDFHRPAYQIKVRGPRPWDKGEGLYDPSRTPGTLIGLLGRPARLSVLEATDRIVNQHRPVQLRGRGGVVHTVSTPEHLTDLLRVSR
jgi:hypothetical protein